MEQLLDTNSDLFTVCFIFLGVFTLIGFTILEEYLKDKK